MMDSEETWMEYFLLRQFSFLETGFKNHIIWKMPVQFFSFWQWQTSQIQGCLFFLERTINWSCSYWYYVASWNHLEVPVFKTSANSQTCFETLKAVVKPVCSTGGSFPKSWTSLLSSSTSTSVKKMEERNLQQQLTNLLSKAKNTNLSFWIFQLKRWNTTPIIPQNISVQSICLRNFINHDWCII